MMVVYAFIAFASIGAAAPNSKKMDHPGPAGCAWGSARSACASTWDDKWERIEQKGAPTLGDSALRYEGAFGGFPADVIEASFAEEELVGVWVALRILDEQPAIVRYESIIAKMRGEYGEPTELVKAPDASNAMDKLARTAKTDRTKERLKALSAVHDDLAGDRIARLERMIREGTWKPKATWLFRNGVEVSTFITPLEPDEYGRRELLVGWAFLKKDVVDAARKRARQERDF